MKIQPNTYVTEFWKTNHLTHEIFSLLINLKFLPICGLKYVLYRYKKLEDEPKKY